MIELVNLILKISDYISAYVPIFISILQSVGVIISIFLGIQNYKLQRESKRLDIKPYLNLITDNTKKNKPILQGYTPNIYIVTTDYKEIYDKSSDFISYPVSIKNIGAGNAIKICIKKIYLESDSKKYILENFENMIVFDYVDLTKERNLTISHPYQNPDYLEGYRNYVIVFSFRDITDNFYEQTMKYPIELTKNHNQYKGSFYGGWDFIEIFTEPPQRV